MNVAVMKTKAEQALSSLVADRLPKLAGSADVRALRAAAAAEFETAGLPHRRIEEWKYSDLRTLLKDVPHQSPASDVKAALAQAAARFNGVDAIHLVFVDGRLATPIGSALPSGVTIQSLATALADNADALSLPLPSTVDAGTATVIALNTALVSDGALIRIAKDAAPDRPIHITFVSSGTVATRNLIVGEAGSTATIIESHISVGHVSAGDVARQANALTQVTVGAGAALTHIVDVATAPGSVHLGTTIATLARDAAYTPFHFTIGDGLVRHQLLVDFAGLNGAIDLGAATLARGSGHGDLTMVIDHAVPHCTSRELFKTVLDGRARGVFQGKVIVRPDAQKTDGKQMAQALMLSEDAEFDSKPELEIYADDVVCGHGTTSTELDADLLFYCKSRGIPETEARALLIESFIMEAIGKVAHDGVREAFQQMARDWLLAGIPAEHGIAKRTAG
ncbi:MAG: Fe-S cluster assembly protein SufD [Hyphomicrobium sp.]